MIDFDLGSVLEGFPLSCDKSDLRYSVLTYYAQCNRTCINETEAWLPRVNRVLPPRISMRSAVIVHTLPLLRILSELAMGKGKVFVWWNNFMALPGSHPR
ncbi:hypothetical protein LWI28_023065 [Acer negundo]|uniref:Uncharacterized protein n=1 Tax=Acer negundo TaxID=4023 RepID=A0AAD5JEC0_ACENE|nr:hypothetical protein LWI28_023065 [Acer negundo]